MRTHVVKLIQTPTANGGDEWRLEVGREGRIVEGSSVFTDAGKTPEEMLPKVLVKVVAREQE